MATLPAPLQRLQQRKELLVIFLFLFVIAVFWISLGIFSSQKRTAISAQQRQLAQPLSPALDESVIVNLENKTVYSQSELADFPIFAVTDSQGQPVLINVREGAGQDNVLLPPGIEDELQDLEAN